jgi:hypothetical protein
MEEQSVVVIPSEEEAYAGGEILVKFTEDVAAMIEESGVVRSEQTRSGITSIDELLEQ